MQNCCTRCFSELLIQQFIEASDIRGNCDYCRSTDVPIHDVDEVGNFVRAGVLRYYEDAANSVHYETAEGGYTMSTDTMTEILLSELDIFNSSHFDPGDLADALADDDGTGYVRQDPYGPPSGEPEEIDNWKQFCETVTNTRRFTAFLSINESENDESHPHRFMQHLADFFNNAFMIATIGVGRRIYRARLIRAEERLRHEDITSTPITETRSNRMSPAGISFFYGCLEEETSIAEVRSSVGDRVAIGEFEVLRDLRILDLSQPIEGSISIFSEDYSFDYEEYIKPFLRQFIADIARPIRPHEADISYIPTQVFTEFIRFHTFREPMFVNVFGEQPSRIPETFNIDGIMFPSSLRTGGTNIVLFRGPDISVSSAAHSTDAWLRYHKYSTYAVRGITYTAERIRHR
jgi:hypothetical protein